MSLLFSPIDIGPLKLKNRLIIAPMCQYSAEDGQAQDWHTIHLGQLALSGAGLLILEAAAVCAEGRITYGDLGLWDDTTASALAKTLTAIRKYSNIPMGIQLAHAGRKASTQKPWHGGAPISPEDKNGWQVIAPSALPFHEDGPVPLAASQRDIAAIVQQFVEAAKRAADLGFEVIEVHAAHGYLLHEFLSPLSNQRQDEFGGSLENRMRLTLDVFSAVRACVPENIVVGVRISATDWVPGGWDVEQSTTLAIELDKLNCHYLHVSSGGLSPQQEIPVEAGYQVSLAEAIKPYISMPVIAVGLITEPHQAEQILADERADAIAMARGILYNPHWAWQAAAELDGKVEAPAQYLRSEPHGQKGHLTEMDLFKNT
ncbi:MAG: NADH:flavin oxidoreductase/NADH oxidase [Pseudomonadota bacterium]|uniref:FMN oxidoreductase n=1 Tax=Methylophaga aminisulfidivorans MP TaxID=1026882 RepID=F5SX89_9GAMM|nr:MULTISPECIES: NADH:flavin oxidoreductase/NADH oxidase [Methylophaga]EGL54982.1 FMN oxidoreductase [Methylophaga aminisulfidivorans MP]MEC9412517.1 NADH:flavin oxidoreductase/NADH oxidase [Pseudomonadota bacterium]WVI84334.1 NADH:flavin oxidoreductase/NADH oxidase [Methylophaga thalassica]